MLIKKIIDKFKHDKINIGRSELGIPHILHRIHAMKRSELEQTIRFAKQNTKIKIKKKINKPNKDINKPSKRRTITSRWTKTAKDAFERHQQQSYVPIT